MTVKIPKPNLADKILKLLGKKRGVFLHLEQNPQIGQYGGYSYGGKEGLFTSLLRPSNKPLPAGMVDINTFEDKMEYSYQDKEGKGER